VGVIKNGKRVAVLLAVEDEEEVERLVLAHSLRFQAILKAARQLFEERGGISHDEFWKEVQKRQTK
jgi:hypothetical protein